MTSILKFFYKIFIKPFYVLNSGFFLLLFILIFGIIHPPQLIFVHASLIHGIINSNSFTCVVLFLWILYNLKCILFSLRIIKKEDDTILFNLQGLSSVRQCTLLLISHIVLYFPVIIYSLFVIYMAYQQGFLLYCAGLVVFQLILCVASVYIYYYYINFTWKPSPAGIIHFPVFNLLRGKAGLPFYLIYYTFHSRKIIFLATKVAGFFLLEVLLATGKEDFEMRDFNFVFMIVVVFHVLLVYYYVEFMEKRMNFSRNLPVSRLHRFLMYLFTYIFILLPEFLFIFINGRGLMTVYLWIVFYFVAVTQLLLFTSVLYVRSMKMKYYLQIIFCIYMVSSMLMLSGGYEMIGIVSLCLSVFIFYRNFYLYEAAL